jgi:Cu-Zn family superoxide dismutase
VKAKRIKFGNLADSKGNGSITFTTSEWGISSADETKNIIGKD